MKNTKKLKSFTKQLETSITSTKLLLEQLEKLNNAIVLLRTTFDKLNTSLPNDTVQNKGLNIQPKFSEELIEQLEQLEQPTIIYHSCNFKNPGGNE